MFKCSYQQSEIFKNTGINCKLTSGLLTLRKATIRPCNPTPGHISGAKHDPKDICTSMFIAALLTIAKTWNKLDVHQQVNG